MKGTNKLEDIKNDFPYKDIINLERPFSAKHPRSNREARAAQFAPFAALNGFEDEIIEVQRLTSKELYLDDEEIAKINNKLNMILESNKNLYINVIYFLRDKRKTGGKYITKSGFVRRIDSYNNVIIFKDKEKVKINDIVKIEIIDLSNDNNLI